MESVQVAILTVAATALRNALKLIRPLYDWRSRPSEDHFVLFKCFTKETLQVVYNNGVDLLMIHMPAEWTTERRLYGEPIVCLSIKSLQEALIGNKGNITFSVVKESDDVYVTQYGTKTLQAKRPEDGVRSKLNFFASETGVQSQAICRLQDFLPALAHGWSSRDEESTRYALAATVVEISHTHSQVTLATTDTRSIAVASIQGTKDCKASGTLPKFRRGLLNPRACKMLLTLEDKSGIDEIKIELLAPMKTSALDGSKSVSGDYPEQLRFSGDGWTLISKCVEGRFPDWEELFNDFHRNRDIPLTFVREALLAALRQVSDSCIAANEVNRTVNIAIDPVERQAKFQDDEKKSTSTIKFTIDETAGKIPVNKRINLNVTFLMRVLEANESHRVEIRLPYSVRKGDMECALFDFPQGFGNVQHGAIIMALRK